jgi:hypothetical protein
MAESYKRQLEELTKTELELLDIEERRAIESAKELATNKENEQEYKKLVDVIQAVFDEKRALLETTEELNDETEEEKKSYADISGLITDYRDKLTLLHASQREAIELEFMREIQAIKASEATQKQMEEATKAVIKYYAELIKAMKKEKEEQEELDREENLKGFKDELIDTTEKVLGFMDAWASGEITDILGEAGSMLIELGKQSGNVYLMIAGYVAEAAAKMVEQVEQAHERIIDVRLRTEQYQRDAIRDRLDWEYEQEIANINRIENEKINAIRETLSKEAEETLIQLGVLEETREQYYQRLYDEALESNENLTKADKERIKEVLDAQREAEEARAEAEKKYKKEMAQWTYDQAVFERDLTIQELKTEWQKARAELGWLGSITHGGKVDAAYNEMIATVQNMPLPPPPEFQTGGIVLPQAGGQMVRVAENGAPELMLNSGPEGEAFLNEFASRIAGMMSGGKTVTIQLDVDGKKLAENAARYYNNGKVRLKV